MTFYYCGQCRLLRRCLDGHFVCGKDAHVIDYNPDIIRTYCRDHKTIDALRLVPPRVLSLEDCLEFLADDELLEVTPESLRIRKRILSNQQRAKIRGNAAKNQ